MKLFFKIIGIFLLVVLLAMVAIPYFFRDQIVEKVKQEINKNVNAQVDFTDFSLSLFRSFPNFNFRLEGLSVVNKAPFEGDTLAWIPDFDLTLDLMSVIRCEAYKLRKVHIRNPRVNVRVTKEGLANYDIMLPSESTPEPTPDESASPFKLDLQHVAINDGRIIYDDKSLTTYALLEGVDFKMSGDFTLDFTSLNTYTSIERVTVIYDGVKYLRNVDAELHALIDADLANSIYTLKKNQLRLNRLFIGFDGSVGMQENGDMNLMLTFASQESEFKNFLSMVPAIYSTNFDGLKTSGTMSIKGNVKGMYTETSYPAFAINLEVNDGYFQYPDLPQAVRDVNIDTRVNFPGGDLDNLTVDVSRFDLVMAGNAISANLFIKNPMSDMHLKGAVEAEGDLSRIAEVYPLEEAESLSGMITADFSFEGAMSAIENERYEDFKFIGSLLMKNFNYPTEFFNEPVHIANAQLNFSPAYLDLVNFALNIGRNDFSATGRIENFMPYFLSDGILRGQLDARSSYLNITDLMPADESAPTNEPTTPAESTSPADTASMGVIEIPADIHFTLTTQFDKVFYDNLELTNVNGKMVVADKAVTLDNLNMGILDGTASLSGKYDTRNPAHPQAQLDMRIADIDIQTAYKNIGTIEKFTPIAEKTQGKFTVNFDMTTLLDKGMMPVYSSLNGNGSLQTTTITIQNVNTFNKLADLLKMPDLKRLLMGPVDLSFEFINGKLHVQPFDIKYADMSASIGGWTALDQTISYDMILTIPRAKFGGAANDILENLVKEANKIGTNFSLGETVTVKANIGGTLSDPTVSIFPGEGSGKSMIDDLKNKALEELQRQKEKLEQEARERFDKAKAEARVDAQKIIDDADQKARKIIADAQQQADATMLKVAQSAEKAKEEARKQADKLLDKAKEEGPLAEAAAKAAIKNLLAEADNTADNLVKAAQKKSDDILDAARRQADKLKADAQERADKTLGGE
ncbi:MAG TPA: AsmA-like C-terminal region-containing protein [Bacteroidales bacterium]|nr:AsmA-like C-terminal region-containing protein [Bacteroidales bacterium]